MLLIVLKFQLLLVCIDVIQIMIQQFTFPRYETLWQEWIRKNTNAILTLTKYTCACENHFTIEEVKSFHVIGDKQLSIVCLRSVFFSSIIDCTNPDPSKVIPRQWKMLKPYLLLYLIPFNITILSILCYLYFKKII